MSKKLEIKQRRREEVERRIAERKAAVRRRNIITVLITLVVIGTVAAVVITQREDGAESIGGDVAEAGCDEIETFPGAAEEDARGHVEEGHEVPYETTPPTFGPHSGTTSPTGFFEEPVPEEAYVHNLEHGQIVIHYDPAISAETKDKVETLTDQEPDATLAVPTEGLEKSVVLTAWGAMQACGEPAQEAVDAFRERFQGRGPEDVGVPTFEGEE